MVVIINPAFVLVEKLCIHNLVYITCKNQGLIARNAILYQISKLGHTTGLAISFLKAWYLTKRAVNIKGNSIGYILGPFS